MKNRRNLWIAGAIALAIVGLVACGKSASNKTTQAHLPKLAVGIQSSPAMALVMVAKDEGFFAKSGVDVQLTQFTAGKFAMQAFLGGSLDVAVTGDVPVALASLQGNKFRVIGQVVESTTNEVRVVARKKIGATTAAVYFHAAKRKLATSIGGGPEFYTYNFLKKYGISPDQVEIVSQRPEDMPASVANGSVDAIAIFDPFATIAEQRLGTSGQTFGDPSLYSELYVINVKDATLTSTKRNDIIAFLKGMLQAQRFVAENPDAAKQVVMKYTKLERPVVDAIWKNYNFRLSLTQTLVNDNIAEARWAIEKGTFPKGTAIPDFRSVLYPDLLSQLAPDQVALDK